jgi:hypothetical protein
MERLDALRAKQVEYDQEVVRLRANLPAVRTRDQPAVGEALAGGDPVPEPKATALEAEIERLTRNSAAMLSVISEEIREVTRLIERAKATWTRDLIVASKTQPPRTGLRSSRWHKLENGSSRKFSSARGSLSSPSPECSRRRL